MRKFRDAFIDAFDDDDDFQGKEEEVSLWRRTTLEDRPINGRKCARSIAMKPSRRLRESDDKIVGAVVVVINGKRGTMKISLLGRRPRIHEIFAKD